MLNDLQNEADEVLDLVLNYPEDHAILTPDDVRKLKAAWAREKEGLLAVIKSLKDLISKTDEVGDVFGYVFYTKLSTTAK